MSCRTECFKSLSATTTNVQGSVCAPLGAVPKFLYKTKYLADILTRMDIFTSINDCQSSLASCFNYVFYNFFGHIFRAVVSQSPSIVHFIVKCVRSFNHFRVTISFVSGQWDVVKIFGKSTCNQCIVFDEFILIYLSLCWVSIKNTYPC